MTTDDLRTRARRAARAALGPFPEISNIEADSYEDGYADGALWHAAQQPTRERIARALFLAERGDTLRPGVAEKHWDEGVVGSLEDEYYRLADAVLALRDGAGS